MSDISLAKDSIRRLREEIAELEELLENDSIDASCLLDELTDVVYLTLQLTRELEVDLLDIAVYSVHKGESREERGKDKVREHELAKSIIDRRTLSLVDDHHDHKL